MYMHENNTNSEDSARQIVLDHMQAGEVHKYEPTSGPYFEGICVVMNNMDISRFDFLRHNLDDIFLGTSTSEFTDRELITDFSGEPYKVLRAISVTVRSLDIGGEVEAAFEEGNIAWVANGKVEAINGLKAEILNTIEDFEANEDKLGSEPTRQLALLRRYVKRTP